MLTRVAGGRGPEVLRSRLPLQAVDYTAGR